MQLGNRITSWLERSPAAVRNAFAASAAFAVYFSMFAFRKPFTAATFEGERFGGGPLELKTALVIAQVAGYGLAKYVGVKFCSEISRSRRAWTLVGLIALAEGAMVLFALLPRDWGVAALLLNGIPLGMVWGLVVLYLEGRQSSELLLATLSASFILADGVVKDVGRALLAGASLPLLGIPLPNPFPPLADHWMPAAAGALFVLPFVAAVALLNLTPAPTDADVVARSRRAPMGGAERLAFVRRFLPGLVLLLAVYFFVAALRDFRSNFNVELLQQLGIADQKDVLTRTESVVAAGVLAVLGTLFLVRDNRSAFIGVFGVMISGLLLISAASGLHDAGRIGAYWWVTLTGLGAYLAYVPFGSVLFDRLLAATRVRGTAVFGIYLCDAAGYTGSVAILLYKDLNASAVLRVAFLKEFGNWLAVGGTTALVLACWYFLRDSRRHLAAEGQ